MEITLDKNIIERLKELKIAILYLFDSYGSETQKEDSDIDLGIVFENTEVLRDSLKIYEELYLIFSKMFDREIDIVFLDKAPLTLKFEVVVTGKIIYSISEEFVYEYKERIIKEYIDFKPLLDEQDRVLLERL